MLLIAYWTRNMAFAFHYSKLFSRGALRQGRTRLNRNSSGFGPLCSNWSPDFGVARGTNESNLKAGLRSKRSTHGNVLGARRPIPRPVAEPAQARLKFKSRLKIKSRLGFKSRLKFKPRFKFKSRLKFKPRDYIKSLHPMAVSALWPSLLTMLWL